MIKFNDNNIVVGEIKQILKEFNLPKCDVIKDGMMIFKDKLYISNGQLYRAKQTIRNINSDNNSEVFKNTFKRIGFYPYGEKLLNITKNLKLDNIIYDSYTHEYLGDYLRFYSDYNNINLMPLYNCFSNRVASNIDLIFKYEYMDENVVTPENAQVVVSDGNDTESNVNVTSQIRYNSVTDNNLTKERVYEIPVKLFKKYTIAIDCPVIVSVCAGFYSNNKLINVFDNMDTFYGKTSAIYGSMMFNHPVVYNGLVDLNSLSDEDLEKIKAQESNLKLFIKVPQQCKSSIVVLEGDYSNGCDFYFKGTQLKVSTPVHFIYKERPDSSTEKYKDGTQRVRIGRLKLLEMNTQVNHPFSDKLLEYLFESAITPKDEIYTNIARLQKKFKVSGSKGIWSDELGKRIYDELCKNYIINTNFDFIGCVDRDIEDKIVGAYDYGKDMEI